MANQQESSPTSPGRAGNGDRGSLSAKSHEAAEQVKGAMVGQVENARQRAQSARDQAAQRLRRIAAELRRAGETLQPQDEFVARLAERVSRSVDGAAGYVSSAELRRLRADTEHFARSRPAAFFGGAFLVGLVLGRFLRKPVEGGDGAAARRPSPEPSGMDRVPLAREPLAREYVPANVPAVRQGGAS